MRKTLVRMVREKGLEPSPLAGPDPKSGASAISPLAHPLTESCRFSAQSSSVNTGVKTAEYAE